MNSIITNFARRFFDLVKKTNIKLSKHKSKLFYFSMFSTNGKIQDNRYLHNVANQKMLIAMKEMFHLFYRNTMGEMKVHEYSEQDRLATPECESCQAYCCLIGYVYVTPDEQKQISEYLSTDIDSLFDQNMIRKIADIGPCQFLTHDSKCSIYAIRPRLCRIFHCQDSQGMWEMKKFLEER